MHFVESRIISISLDTDVVTILHGEDVDYEYCAKVTLNNELLRGKCLSGIKVCIIIISLIA